MTDTHQTLDDVAERIGQLPGSILDFDEPEAAPSEKDEAAPEKQKDSSPEQPEKAEAGEEEAEDTDKDKEAEAEEPEEGEPAPEEDDPVYEVTLPDGTTEEKPVSELAQGWLASREVETAKAEAADTKRLYESRMQEVPHLVQQAVKQEQDKLAQTIEQFAQANAHIQPPSMDMLDPNSESYNPDQYRLEEARYLHSQRQMQEAAHHLQEIARQREQQQRDHEAQEREKLKAAWPELLSDSAKQGAFLKQVQDHFGLTADEVRGITDHRHFLILRDAVGYREMKAKAPDVRQKAKAPKPKPVKAGPRSTAKDSEKAEYSEQRKRLKKTGRPEDAMAVLEKMDF